MPERLPGHTSEVASQSGAAARTTTEMKGRPALLFEAGPHLAVSLKSDSMDLPAPPKGGAWRLASLTLGQPDAAHAGLPPEKLLAAIAGHAHDIWPRQAPA